MSIAHYKPTAQKPIEPEVTYALPDNYNGNLYDNKKVPLTSLIAYISGASWTVNYYRQQVSKHNDLKEIDPNLDPVYQAYELVKGMEIRVDSQLTSTTNSDDQRTSVQGSGYIYPFLTPNRNDYFITDTNDSKKALFLVRSVERKTFQESSVHLVSYILVRYLERGDPLLADLEKKTVREMVFSKDRLVQGLSPVLKMDTYQALTQLRSEYSTLVKRYFATFFNVKCYSLVLPGQMELIYDPYLVDFLFEVVDSHDAVEIARTKRYQTDSDEFMLQPNFWSLLLSRRYDLLSEYNRKMGLASVQGFDDSSYIRDAYHGIMNRIVYPVTPDLSYQSGVGEPPLTSFGFNLVPTVNYLGSQLPDMDNQYALVNTVVNLYPKVSFTDSYVLSLEFYNDGPNKSILEILVKDYLKGQTLNLKYIQELIEKYPLLARMEQFYYGPILLLLIKEAVRAAY